LVLKLISAKHLRKSINLEKIKKTLAYPPALVNYLQMKIIFSFLSPFWNFVTRVRGMGVTTRFNANPSNQSTEIDEFWSQNTVYAPQIHSAFQSRLILGWRFRIHPKFKELSGLYGDHDNEIILDYGCGLGNDLTGFAIRTGAKKIIGMDVSHKSLALAAHRLALHKIDVTRIELMQIQDGRPVIELADESIDYVSCQGVLMHTSFPEKILAEFYRVLKPNSKACVMVYSQPSVWFNLYTAYEQMIVRNAFPGMDIEQAFSRNTDGLDCPMARCFPVSEFMRMCEQTGFKCQFAGGYLTETEMISLNRYLRPALNDPALDDTHKQFLHSLSYDKRGFPVHQGYYAGVSGVYQLHKK
jgi:ubiquinone/menaquinone biosynthesis C-methylase UbiE